MIVYVNALIASVKVRKSDTAQQEMQVARYHKDENDTAGTYYIRGEGSDVFRKCTITSILNFLISHPDFIDSKGIAECVPVEIISEQLQLMANNRIYCLRKRQHMLLRNLEFCDVLVDKFKIERNGVNAVIALQEATENQNLPSKLFAIVQKIESNTFIDIKACNLLRAVMSYRSKYIPKCVIKCFENLSKIYPEQIERELFFDAIACMNCEPIKRKIMNIKHDIYKKYIVLSPATVSHKTAFGEQWTDDTWDVSEA